MGWQQSGDAFAPAGPGWQLEGCWQQHPKMNGHLGAGNRPRQNPAYSPSARITPSQNRQAGCACLFHRHTLPDRSEVFDCRAADVLPVGRRLGDRTVPVRVEGFEDVLVQKDIELVVDDCGIVGIAIEFLAN